LGSKSHGGYKHNYFSLDSNIRQLARKYPLDSNGRFGVRDRGAQVLRSSTPLQTAKDFFTALGRGGKLQALEGGRVLIYKFPNGHQVVFRESSSDGSPAIQIILGRRNASSYKIHFTKLEGERN